MKGKHSLILMMAIGGCMLLAGCASTEVTATYVVAPRKIANLKDLKAIRILAEIHLHGNAVEPRDKAATQLMIQQDLTARLDQEGRGSILVKDAYFAEKQTERQLVDYLKQRGKAYGYGQISPDPAPPYATLKLNLTMAVNRQQKNFQANFHLLNTPYRLIYDPYDRWREPEAVPFIVGQRSTYRQAAYALWGIQAAGSLNATLLDAQGRVLYARNFPQLNMTCQNRAVGSLPTGDLLGTLASATGQLQDHQRQTFQFNGNLWPLPTTCGILRRITEPCLTEIIRDIIPNRQRMRLQLNESGNEQLMMLIRGKAYREALAYADTLQERHQMTLSAADWENKGTACECLGQLSQARYCYAIALKLQPGSAIATEALKRLGN